MMMRLMMWSLLVGLLASLSCIAPVAEEICFLKRERIDGLNKICYYDCASGDAAITVKSYQLCPQTINR